MMDESIVKSKDFMGSGLSFPLRVNTQNGRFVMSRHEENIHESVRLILQTYQGERVMHPSYGAVAENILFSDLNAGALADIESKVLSALEDHEPRIMDITVKALRENRSELSIEISYIVRTTNNLYSKVYPFYILEGAGA